MSFLRLTCTWDETCVSVWPPNASLYASSTCVYLRLLAAPFDQGFILITSSNQRLWVRSTPYSNFNTHPFNDFPLWLLTSVYCKINIFSSTIGVLHKDISVAKSMPFWSNRTGPGTNCVAWRCQFPQTRKLKGLKYLDPPSNFVLNIVTLT